MALHINSCKLIALDYRSVPCIKRKSIPVCLRSHSPSVLLRRLVCEMPRTRRIMLLRQSRLISRSFAADYSDLEVDGPETSKEAISEGLKLHRSGRYHEALRLFHRSLDLPGSGARIYRNKAPGTSQGEKIAAFYNIACCYSALKESRKALVSLAACMEVGYRDFQNLAKDPDLAHVRKDPRFVALLMRYQVTEDSLSKE